MINTNIFYGGYTNTVFGHNKKQYNQQAIEVHQRYYEPMVLDGQILKKGRKNDSMRNYKQLFNEAGNLIEFHCLDTFDQIERRIVFHYNKDGYRTKQIAFNKNGTQIDSVVYDYYKNGLIKSKYKCYSANLDVPAAVYTQLKYEYELISNNEVLEKFYRLPIDTLIRAKRYVFNEQGYLKSIAYYNEKEAQVTKTYEYDNKGRTIEEASFRDGAFNTSMVYEFQGDTLALMTGLNHNQQATGTIKYKMSIDAVGNPVQCIYLHKGKPHYIMERTIRY